MTLAAAGVRASGSKSDRRTGPVERVARADRHSRPTGAIYLESTWIGFVLLGVVAVRSLIFYRHQPTLPAIVLLLAVFGLLYLLAPALAARFSRFPLLYFLLQTGVSLALSGRQPFLDVIQILYIPLSLQAWHAFAFRPAVAWLALFAICLNGTLVLAIGWLEGLAFSLLMVAACAFLFSYDGLSARMQRDRDESQRLLAELQQAHQKLQEQARHAEELVAVRERNRLAHELHDSVSQSISAITLTTQSARLLLVREPTRVPELLNRLQEMTATALAQLRPPPPG